jgi:hypothetical protein
MVLAETLTLRCIQIRVRYCNGTYVARSGGKQASATAGEQQAAERLAEKLGFGPRLSSICVRSAPCGCVSSWIVSEEADGREKI